MTALWTTIGNEKSLLSLCHSHLLSSAVFSGLELGLFEVLSRRDVSSVEELASEINVPVANTYRLVRLLVCMGLLEQVGDGIRNSPLVASLLVSSSPDNCVSVLRYQARNVYPAYHKLTDALRIGRTEHQPANYGLNDQLDSEAYGDYLGGSNFYSRGIGTALSTSIDFSKVKHVIDFSSGGGQVAQELMEALPHIHMTLIDRPEAHRYLLARPEMGRFADRFSCITGDVFEPPSIERETADVVVLSSVLGDWEKNDRSTILRHARSVLRPGGTLLITETLLNEDGLGPLRAGVISLYVLLLTKGGDNYPASLWKEEIHENGFLLERVVRNADKEMRDFLVAKKPIS